MPKVFDWLYSNHSFRRASPPSVFDAEFDTPELFRALHQQQPRVRQIMDALRTSLPLPPNAGIGAIGSTGFLRLPNHYRSITFSLSAMSAEGDGPGNGVIVFKGLEPLLDDFSEYFDWMLKAPFRASHLPMGLHFPLDMKLPPAAMWIAECSMEQGVSSELQSKYLSLHGRLARLPVPLFVFRLTPEQQCRYETVIRARLPEDALGKIKAKLGDGLGVEVYYYPDLPVRVADLAIEGVREVFRRALAPAHIDRTYKNWVSLLAEILHLGYMPYAPWHHGMGGCIDPGNACIDGGFNDLLTLVPFSAIPSEVHFRRALLASTRILADSMTGLAAASVGTQNMSDSEVTAVASAFVISRLRDHLEALEVQTGVPAVPWLKASVQLPDANTILRLTSQLNDARNHPTQYVPAAFGELTKLRSVALGSA
jgi:hypothetical protein